MRSSFSVQKIIAGILKKSDVVKTWITRLKQLCKSGYYNMNMKTVKDALTKNSSIPAIPLSCKEKYSANRHPFWKEDRFENAIKP